MVILSLLLVGASFQASANMKINRIFVDDALYSSAIIFEYANAAMPEGAVFRKEMIDCLVSEMKATGLFAEVQVKLEPLESERMVDIHIVPVWSTQAETITVDELVFEGFKGIDVEILRENILREGLSLGVPVLRLPLSKLKEKVQETAREIYRQNPRVRKRWYEELFYLSVRVRAVAPNRVKLFIATGQKPLC